MIDPKKPKTWQNRPILIKELENKANDLEWNGEDASSLRKIIEQENELLETEGELVVPF